MSERYFRALVLLLGVFASPYVGSDADIAEIIDATGDGGGNTLDSPDGIATDSAGSIGDNAFKITPAGRR